MERASTGSLVNDDETETECQAPAPRARSASLVHVAMPPLDIPKAVEGSGDETSTSSGRRRRLLLSSRLSSRSTSPSLSPKKKYVPMPLSLDPKSPVKGVLNNNSKAAVRDILARIKRGPSANDCHGFIYMYEYEHDADPRYRKIGRSERLPAKRCAEWPGSKLIKSWRCRRDRFAEVLIHWLLDSVRCCRYVMGINEDFKFEILISKFMATKEYVNDANYDLFRAKDLSTDTTGKTRHQEWFLADQAVLIKVIDAVVTDVNMHWASDEPWSELMEQMK